MPDVHIKSRAPSLITLLGARHGNIAVLGRRPATGAVARQRGRCGDDDDDDDSGRHPKREPANVMYTAPHPASTSINGMGSDMIDGSGTINPAALNTPGNHSSPRPGHVSRPPPLGEVMNALWAIGHVQEPAWGCCRGTALHHVTTMANVGWF